MNRHAKFFVYIIQDKNGTYYTGYTKDINKRLELHEKGTGAKYLRGRQPLKLVFLKEYSYYKNALAAEQRIKKYTRDRKETLIKIYAQSGTNGR
ncbi:MAG: GIY-YIG nuclease family protein [Candidatus Omnitrophica bacterium]|nr:GIY-YIG nuclease family protein [Candidatus Omnitrophota bacterium]